MSYTNYEVLPDPAGLSTVLVTGTFATPAPHTHNFVDLEGSQLRLPDGTLAVPGLQFTGPLAGGLAGGTYGVYITNSATAKFQFYNNELRLSSDGLVEWSSGVIGSALDIVLSRAAAGILSLSTGSAMYFPSGTALLPGISTAANPATGIQMVNNTQINLSLAGASYYQFATTKTVLSPWITLSNNDCSILRDAANTLALRNGVNAQTFNIYNTYTSGSVYERGGLQWTGNVLQLFSAAAGGGTVRELQIREGSDFPADVILAGQIFGS